jgi:hypothetical protein
MDENDKPQNVPTSNAPNSDQSKDSPQTNETTYVAASPATQRKGLYPFRAKGQSDNQVLATGSLINTTRVAKKKKTTLILLVGVAVLLAAFALLYVYWFQNPNKVVTDSLSHALSAESFTYTGTVTSVSSTKMNVDINGGVSSKGGTVNADFTFDTNDKKYSLEGDGLMDAKSDLYVRVKSIDELVANYRSSVPINSQPLFDQIIAKINNKWIKISANDIK